MGAEVTSRKERRRHLHDAGMAGDGKGLHMTHPLPDKAVEAGVGGTYHQLCSGAARLANRIASEPSDA